jgi:glutamate dehydrogenase (NAD(P)+)
LRSFVRSLSTEVPEEYVFGLDMGLTERDAAIIQHELGDRRAAVGSPRELGGVPYDRASRVTASPKPPTRPHDGAV